MKKTASIIASVLLIAVLISALAVNVFAANTTLTSFSMSAYPSSYTYIPSPQEKTNVSDMVIYITSGTNSSYYVRAVDCDKNGSNCVNYTMLNNTSVDHVTVQRGTIYSVDSLVYYYGYKYATFGIKSPGNPGSVSGSWAPDSLEQFATPTA